MISEKKGHLRVASASVSYKNPDARGFCMNSYNIAPRSKIATVVIAIEVPVSEVDVTGSTVHIDRELHEVRGTRFLQTVKEIDLDASWNGYKLDIEFMSESELEKLDSEAIELNERGNGYEI